MRKARDDKRCLLQNDNNIFSAIMQHICIDKNFYPVSLDCPNL